MKKLSKASAIISYIFEFGRCNFFLRIDSAFNSFQCGIGKAIEDVFKLPFRSARKIFLACFFASAINILVCAAAAENNSWRGNLHLGHSNVVSLNSIILWHRGHPNLIMLALSKVTNNNTIKHTVVKYYSLKLIDFQIGSTSIPSWIEADSLQGESEGGRFHAGRSPLLPRLNKHKISMVQAGAKSSGAGALINYAT